MPSDAAHDSGFEISLLVNEGKVIFKGGTEKHYNFALYSKPIFACAV